ncbi:hypothetical protein [Motilimonas eburnea]|uniref:hypothetical protein n=1 Tax=Motilimonas eburnea TaxID=1737488 RepID=UPI001E34FDEC|nr:hypothetical protein [Motilimonas eburnea]MCE2571713.1 hypothetical protein [Motilimonas eburnea]
MGEVNAHLPKIKIDSQASPILQGVKVRTVSLSQNDNGFCKVSSDSAWVTGDGSEAEKRCLFEFTNIPAGLSDIKNLSIQGIPRDTGLNSVGYKVTFFSGTNKKPIVITEVMDGFQVQAPTAPKLLGVTANGGGVTYDPNQLEINDRNGLDQFTVNVEPRAFDQKIMIDNIGDCDVLEGSTKCQIDMSGEYHNKTELKGSLSYEIKANSLNMFFAENSIYDFVSKWDFTPPSIELFAHNVSPDGYDLKRSISINGQDVEIVNNIAKIAVTSSHDQKGGDWWLPKQIELNYAPIEGLSFDGLELDGKTLMRATMRPSSKQFSLVSNGEPTQMGNYYVYDVDVSSLEHGKFDATVKASDKYNNTSTKIFNDVRSNRAETDIGLFYEYTSMPSTGTGKVFFEDSLVLAAFNGLAGDAKVVSAKLNGEDLPLSTPNAPLSFTTKEFIGEGFEPYSTHQLDITAVDGYGIEYNKSFSFDYMPLNFTISNVPEVAFATIQTVNMRLENEGEKCAFMPTERIAKASARPNLHTCSISWPMLPQGFVATPIGRNYLVSGIFSTTGANDFGYEVTMHNHKGASKVVPSNLMSIDVKEPPAPSIDTIADRFEKRLDSGLYVLEQDGGYFTKTLVKSAPADVDFTIDQSGEQIKYTRIRQRPRSGLEQQASVPVKNKEGKLWQEVDFDLTAKYNKAPELATTKTIRGVYVPPKRVRIGMSVVDDVALTTRETTFNVGIGQYDRATRSDIYDPEVLGKWKVHLENKINYRESVPITDPVELSADGKASFKLASDKIGEYGGQILAVGELISEVEGYTRKIVSKSTYVRVYKGEKLEGGLVASKIIDTVPMSVRVRYKPDTKLDDRSLGDIRWEISTDNQSWNEMPEYKNQEGINHEQLEPGEFFIRAVIHNDFTGATNVTEPLQLIAFERPELKLEGERMKITGETFTFKLLNMGKEANVAEGDIEWSTDKGKTWVPGEEEFSFEATEGIRYVSARMRYNHADQIETRAWGETYQSVKVMEILPMKAKLKLPRSVEVGQPIKLEAEPRLPYYGVTRPTKAQWIRANGEIVEGSELAITMSEDDIVDDMGHFTYQTWIEGRKDETMFSKTVDIKTYRYELPDIAIKLTPKTRVVPAEVKVQIEMGRVEAPDVEIKTNVELNSGMTLISDNGRYSVVKVNDAGLHEIRVRVSDNRGNDVIVKEFVELLDPEPMNIEVADYLSPKRLREPVTSIMSPRVKLGHPQDQIVSYEWFLNGDKVGESRIGEFKDMKAGANSGKLVIKTAFGQMGELPITYNVAENIPPICEVETGETISSVYFVARCSDEDGAMVGYRWLINGDREVTGSKISFLKADKELISVSLKGYDDSGAFAEAAASVQM